MPLRKSSHAQIASEDSAISSHPSRSASSSFSSSSSSGSSTSSGLSSSDPHAEESSSKSLRHGHGVVNAAMPSPPTPPPPSVSLKLGMVGDSSVGKTQLMLSSVVSRDDPNSTFSDAATPMESLASGVNLMDKTVRVGTSLITFNIWDLGGQKETISMLPLVCSDAVVILYVFDLTRKSSLNGIKEWYRQVRGFNRDAVSLLVGTKYDLFQRLEGQQQSEITRQAKRFANAMHCPLVYTSSTDYINVQSIYQVALAKVFDLDCTLQESSSPPDPILLYRDDGSVI